ncbi:hypothetical protein, partial [Neisseria meningitidis]|uniref:hypothetical protein n=2 Tax=Neisseria meningitidis TaxID=487 RepID=UPI001C5ADA05
REAVDVFGNHGLCGLPEEGAHEKSPKCLGGNLGDFGGFCKGLKRYFRHNDRHTSRNLCNHIYKLLNF